jgi:uncharacterized protein YbjT (DUF2867 family)
VRLVVLGGPDPAVIDDRGAAPGSSMILVIGATGTVGSPLIQELVSRGANIRAFVRDSAAARARLGTRIALAEGDLAEAETIQRALRGVASVFLACANGPRQVEFETNAIEAAAAAGISLVVKLSAALAAVGSPLEVADWNARIEQVLWASGCPAVVLRPGFYMSNVLTGADEVRRCDKLRAPAGNARIAMIDPRDVAAAAAVALTEPVEDGVTHALTGPEAISYEQIAICLSEVTGRKVEFVDTSDDAARKNFAAAGMPQWMVEHLVKLFEMLRASVAVETTDTVRTLTGQDPRTFPEFAHHHAAAFSR